MFHSRKPVILLAPLAALLIAAAPVSAPSGDLAPRAERLGQAAEMVDGGKPAEALLLLDGLLAESDLPADRGEVELLRSFALARLGRIPDARQSIETAYASSFSPTPVLLRQLFLLRALTGDMAGSAAAVQLMAASDPRWLNALPGELVLDVLGSLDEAPAFDLAFSLVAAKFAPDDVTLGDLDRVRMTLIHGLHKRGRLDEAGPAIAQLINPVSLVRLGIDRRFQSLWPQLEARLGPGADTADEAFVAATKARLDRQPQSLIARLGHAEALNIASREEDAIAIADVAKDTAVLEKMANRELWLVNLHAMMLADTGKVDEGLARITQLATLPDNGRPMLMVARINRAVLAEGLDKPDLALEAVAAAEAASPQMADFGKLYLAAVKACALAQKGDKAAAAATAAPLLAKPDANQNAALGAMHCLGQRDAAAALLIRQIEDEKTRDETLFSLQPFLIEDRPTARDRRDRAALRALKARPDVKAAFVRYGRDLPAAVAPPR